jgi:N-acetylglucosamine kinase-like BadF-type ATPase
VCALLLGVRADSTHTEAVLANFSGQPFGYVMIPNGEARSSRELLERAFQEASIEYSGPIPPLVAVMALPGLHSAPIRRAAGETVRAVLPAGSRAILCDQLEAVLAAGLHGEPGHVLSVGHEAAVASVTAQGVFSRTEEPAEIMGQEGSGLWLGTRTLQLAARLREGRLPDAPRLVGLLTEHFGKSSLQEVWDTVMADAPDAISITALAERTITLSEFPDPEPACRALVVRAARRLCDLLAQAMTESEGETLATWHGRSAMGALLDEVHRQTPEMRWQAPRMGALAGCLFMGRAYGERDLGEGECQVEEAGPPLWLAMRERKDALLPLAQEIRSPS